MFWRNFSVTDERRERLNGNFEEGQNRYVVQRPGPMIKLSPEEKRYLSPALAAKIRSEKFKK